MAETWTVRRERSNHVALVVIAWIARRLGRGIARLALHPIVAYYALTAPGARTASRDYLGRVLEREPRWRDLYRHMYCFAAALLDRVYMFGGHGDTLEVSHQGAAIIRDYRRRGVGAIVIVAHLGSFEILRAVGGETVKLPLRVLMNRASGAKANAVLDAIHPTMGERIIDTSESDVDRVLKVKAALDRGEMVGLMADRYHSGERTTDVSFLGDPAPMPLSPWLLAGITRAPVLLAFGLYRGGNRYELHFEEFSQGLALPRARRHAQAHEYAQAYADRLAYYTRKAPYNWFNFYDFWHS